ncbi:unnamed protein product, partial [Chrysoparadoxa australica]
SYSFILASPPPPPPPEPLQVAMEVVTPEVGEEYGDPASQGKTRAVLVTRKPRPSEIELFQTGPRAAQAGLTLPSIADADPAVDWDSKKLVSRNVLGTVEEFERVESNLSKTLSKSSSSRSQLNRSATGIGLGRGDTGRSGLGVRGGLGSSKAEASKTSADKLNSAQEAYVRRLQKASQEAARERQATKETEKSLLEKLATTDRMELTRQSRALQHWEARQKDWAKVKDAMAQKLGKSPEELMMSTADEYRERSEAYQLIQAAVPPHEKYGSESYWEMSLRDFGERYCLVGNIFSGLFCTIEDHIAPPKLVARPRSQPTDTTRHKTWRNSPQLARKTKQLAGTMKKTARPCTQEHQSTMALLIKGTDLFEWAVEGSKRHLEDLEMERLREEMGEAVVRVPWEEREAKRKEAEQRRRSSVRAGQRHSGPGLLVQVPRYVLMESAVDVAAIRSIEMKNTGSTVLFYKWTRVPEDDEPEGNDGRFLCHNSEGSVMPGATASVCFNFMSKCSGIFTSDWRVATSPQAHVEMEAEVVRVTNQEEEEEEDAGDSHVVHLRGVATAPDLNEHHRAALRGKLDQGVLAAKLEEIVTDVIRAVKTPVRERDIRERQCKNFSCFNADRGLFFTPVRYDAFVSLLQRVRSVAIAAEQGAYNIGVDGADQPDEEGTQEVVDCPQLDVGNEDHEDLPMGTLIAMLRALNAGDWNGSVGEIEEVIESLSQWVPEEDPADEKVLEQESKQDEAEISGECPAEGEKEEGEDQPEGAGEDDVALDKENEGEDDEDDDDEDEEDEEDEEEEEDEVEEVEPEVPQHPLVREQQALKQEWRRLLLDATLMPMESIEASMARELELLADAVVAAAEQAEIEASLPEDHTFEPICRYGEEAEASWAAIVPDVETAGTDDPKARAAKATGPEQAFRILAYSGIQEGFMCFADRFETALSARDQQQRLHDLGKRYTVPVGSVAALRREDVAGQRVVLYVDLDVGDALTPVEPVEGCGEILWELPPAPAMLPEKLHRAVEDVKQMLAYKPSALAIMTQLHVKAAEVFQQAEGEAIPKHSVSCRALAETLRDHLALDVEFYSTLPAMAEQLVNIGAGAADEWSRVMMVEAINQAGVVPPPEPEEPVYSDDEEERLPGFDEPKEADEEEVPIAEPAVGDLAETLEDAIDVAVINAPGSLYAASHLFLGNLEERAVMVAGHLLHGDLCTAHYLMNLKKQPVLAILGGQMLEPKLQLLDSLIEWADEIALGGGLANTVLASAGHAIAAADPPDVLRAARKLLLKARRYGVKILLPVDFVAGDLQVTKEGTVPGQIEEEDEDAEEGEEGEQLAAEGDDMTASVLPEEEEDPTAGFEYQGETSDVTLEQGIPRKLYAQDIGPQTVALFKEAIGSASTIIWHGTLGIVECSAFQQGTREVLEAVTLTHDNLDAKEAGNSPVVTLCGTALAFWARRFFETDNDELLLGEGEGVSHVFSDSVLCRMVLEGKQVPGLGSFLQREPLEDELLLEEVLRDRQAQMEDADSEEDDEEEEDDED